MLQKCCASLKKHHSAIVIGLIAITIGHFHILDTSTHQTLVTITTFRSIF